nr:hypothetical protein [Tanacetum cinerariifolium]
MKKKDKGWLEFMKQLNLFTQEEWENIRARAEADEELAQRLQAKERNKYNEVDKAKMLVDIINQRKIYFVVQKAEAKWNKPMTQAQQRAYIGRASKLVAGSLQATITDSAKVESSKRAVEAELDYEGSKRQKTNEASGKKGSGRGRGVKEKDVNGIMKNTCLGMGVSTEYEDTMNDDAPTGVAPSVQEGVTPSVVDITVEMEKRNSLDDTINRDLFHHYLRRFLLRLVMPLHANENLLKEDVSTASVWVKLHGVPVTAFSKDGLSAVATKLGTPLMLDSYTSAMCMQSWGRSSYARVMVELKADMELKYNIVVAMPKITREGHYTCNVHVEYDWKPYRCFSCKVFRHVHEECTKNTGAEYRSVTKKPNASSSGNKKKSVEPTIEVSKSNLFDVLNSVDNDGEFGKLRLLDNDGNPLVPTGIVESDSEVELDSYPDNVDYDPYDDDMYKNHDLSEHLQSICDDLDITVRGRKNK